MSTAIIVIAPHSIGLLPTGKLMQWSSPAKQVSTLCVLPGFRSALEIHRKAIAIIVALRILLWVILALLPSEIAQEAREELGFQSIIKHESQEAAAAYQDHDAVATWILQSLGSPESAQIPTSVAQVLYPFLAPYGGFDKPPISVPQLTSGSVN